MPRGGARPNSGPKLGTTYRKTRVKRAAQTRALRQADITAERVMLEIARVAMVDRRTLWKDGKLLPMSEWPADAAALLEGFEVIVKNAAAGDGHTDTVHKVQLAKKLGALELLAKHFGLASEKLDVTVTDGRVQRLISARKRLHGT